MDKIVVITIIAVFWFLGLLTAWSMCVVAARADRRMEENRHARQRIQTRRLEHQSLTGSGADYKNKIHMISHRFK